VFARRRVALLALALVGMVAFGAFAMKNRRSRHLAAAAACHQPIVNACDKHKCQTFTEAAQLARLVWRDRVQVGVCGTLRYVAVADGFVASVEFFDGRGTLVAAADASDEHSPPCEGRFTYGPELEAACAMTLNPIGIMFSSSAGVKPDF
jgi:hypothetical protein